MLHESEYETMETPVEKVGYSAKRTAITALSPLVLLTPLLFKDTPETYSTTSIPVNAPIVTPLQPVPSPFTTEAIALTQQAPALAEPVGVVADKSFEALATILDPILKLMVEMSLPIAGVIIVGACFVLMLGNSEKAWDMMFKCGLGFVLIQMSPLFLEILRQIGELV